MILKHITYLIKDKPRNQKVIIVLIFFFFFDNTIVQWDRGDLYSNFPNRGRAGYAIVLLGSRPKELLL